MANKPKAYDWEGFTDKERLFCYEYIIDKNKTKAAIRAGYSERTAGKTGWEISEKPKIKARIDEMMEDTFSKLEVTRENIIAELARIALSDIGEMFNEDGTMKPLHEIPEDTRRAIAGVDVDELFEGRGEEREHIGFTKKLKMWDKNKALELLGKSLKMWTDKLEVSDRPRVIRKDFTGKARKGQ